MDALKGMLVFLAVVGLLTVLLVKGCAPRKLHIDPAATPKEKRVAAWKMARVMMKDYITLQLGRVVHLKFPEYDGDKDSERTPGSPTQPNVEVYSNEEHRVYGWFIVVADNGEEVQVPFRLVARLKHFDKEKDESAWEYQEMQLMGLVPNP